MARKPRLVTAVHPGWSVTSVSSTMTRYNAVAGPQLGLTVAVYITDATRAGPPFDRPFGQLVGQIGSGTSDQRPAWAARGSWPMIFVQVLTAEAAQRIVSRSPAELVRAYDADWARALSRLRAAARRKEKP